MNIEEVFKIIFGSCCVLLLFGLGGLGWYMHFAEKKIVREGETLFAPIVQANNELFLPGKRDLPAQVLICFEPDSPPLRQRLLRIAARAGELKEREPADAQEEVVAGFVRDESARWGKREQLPLEFAEGLTVYAVAVSIVRDQLPERRLTRRFIFCRAIPGDEGDVVMIRHE